MSERDYDGDPELFKNMLNGVRGSGGTFADVVRFMVDNLGPQDAADFLDRNNPGALRGAEQVVHFTGVPIEPVKPRHAFEGAVLEDGRVIFGDRRDFVPRENDAGLDYEPVGIYRNFADGAISTSLPVEPIAGDNPITFYG